jgi:hypothetical protein
MAYGRAPQGLVGILQVAEEALRYLHHELGQPPPDPVDLETEAMALIRGIYGTGWYLHPSPVGVGDEVIVFSPSPGPTRNGAPEPTP